jgi:alkanesulfonate monooxygenase SsuD/methylene tetrahydromethanopterin reductase-like flavin-dependent oxidoreductase (luciferase family)
MGNERKIGLSVSGNIPLLQLSSLAKEAEAAGFESLWIHETYFMRDAITQLTASAFSTKTMKLATGCINPFTRNTTVIAMTLATLDEYSPGRFILGIGTGYPLRLNQMGIDLVKPVWQLEKRIEEIRELLAGNAIQKGAKLMFKLPDRSIPVFVGVRKKAMLRMAARVADGYIAAPAESIQSTKRIVSELNANRPPRFGKMEVASNILTYVAKTEKEALEIARKDPFVTYMMAVLDDRTLIESGFSLEDREKVASPYMKGKLEEASSKIKDEMLQSFTAVGDYDSVVEKLAEFRKAGVDLPLLLPIKADIESLKTMMQITPYYISA